MCHQHHHLTLENFYHPRETLYLSHHPDSSLASKLSTATNLLSFCAEVSVLDVSHELNRMCGLICLASFTQLCIMFSRVVHVVMCQYFISLYDCIIVHGLEIPHFLIHVSAVDPWLKRKLLSPASPIEFTWHLCIHHTSESSSESCLLNREALFGNKSCLLFTLSTSRSFLILKPFGGVIFFSIFGLKY